MSALSSAQHGNAGSPLPGSDATTGVGNSHSINVYLNAASWGPLPPRSRDAIAAFNERRARADLTDRDLNAPLKASRIAAANLINASPDEIALTPNTQVAINIAANAVAKLSPDRIIASLPNEFPANVYPWLKNDYEQCENEAALIERINSGDVGAVAVSWVNFSTGFRTDLKAIGAACRNNGALFIVDAMQGIGALPFDVKELQPDFVACGGQKWLCSPWGSGFAYVRSELIEKFTLDYPGWLSYEATQDFTRLTSYDETPLNTAKRFEVGSIAYQDFVGFQSAVELLLENGIDNIWQHIRSLQDQIIEWANVHYIDMASSLDARRRSGIICIRPPRVEQAHAKLIEANVRCALREGSIRISPHYYNTKNDIARLLDVLEDHINQ